MIRPGLLSVTFRDLSPERIVELASNAGLAGIEWGGDVHVPHGNLTVAERVRQLTANAGLAVSAYGSYYRLDRPDGNCPDIAEVLDTAEALGATTVRVWAGAQGSADMSEAQRNKVTVDLRRVGELALEHGIAVGLEYHSHTLTDTLASTQRLLREVDHPSIHLFWQPPTDMSPEAAVGELEQLKHAVGNIHVFHWVMENGKIEQKPLAEGERSWRDYLDVLRDLPGTGDRFASLEFVKDGSVEQFQEDAATLVGWLERLG